MRRPNPLPAWVAVSLCFALAGCASSQAFRAGERAERRQEYDRALLEFSRAVHLAPDNLQYRKSQERARLRSSEQHAMAARRLRVRGQLKEAVTEFRLALDLAPGATALAKELEDASALLQAGSAEVSLEAVKERAREQAFPGLLLGPRAKEPLGLTVRGGSLRDTYTALGKSAGVNFVFDPQFQDQPINLDLKDAPLQQALAALASAGRTFYRVTDAHVLTVIPDTPTKRREYEQQVVKTFFLSNADLKETIDLLRVVLGARRVAPMASVNALTINDSPDKVAAAERIIEVVDRRRAEVMVEVEILEVNRSRLKEYGLEITSAVSGTEGVAGLAFPDPRNTATLDHTPYTAANIVISQLPGVIYRLLRTDTSTRLLANPQLRTTEGATAQARFGDQVPVPVTTFSPIAQGGVSQQPITSFDYKNVGVNIDITPRVHHDGEVTLGLKLEISSVGPLFQNLPTFQSRIVNSVIRLKDGETNILAGLISDQERASFSGLPGLSSLPILGRLFAHNKKEVQETDIVMTLTPHVLRRAKLEEDDLRSFPLGGESSPLLFEVPNIPAISAPGPAKGTEPPRIEPIRPPTPTASPTPQPIS